MRTAALTVFLTATCLAAAPAPVKWSGKDVDGNAISVPQRNRPCLVLFVQTDQSRSHDALKQLKSLPREQLASIQVSVVVSGERAAQRAKELSKSGDCPWPAVADLDYAASDAMAVRVWPTTLLVLPSGEVAAHLAGLPPTYARDLDAHLAFATGAIKADERDRRLAAGDTVADTPQQAAQRRIQTARRLLDKGMTDQALALLDEKTEQAVPRWQIDLIRGIASAKTADWQAARKLLLDATKLNPDPAEAWYRLGLVHQRQKQWEQAADAFRKAFEATEAGRTLAAD